MYAFLHIPKTGGSTFKELFRTSFGPRHCDMIAPRGRLPITRRYVGKHRWLYPFGLKSICSHELINAYRELGDMPDVRFVALIRDPVRRSASHYQHDYGNFAAGRTDACPPFDEWIELPENRNRQLKFLTGEEDLVLAKKMLAEKTFFVGVTEQLRDSIEQFSVLAPEPFNPTIPDKNVSQDNTVKNRLLEDGNAVAKMEEANNLDLQLYRFVVDEVLPAQTKRFEALVAAGKTVRTVPDKRRLGRFYTNLVYRPSWKLVRLLGWNGA